MMFFLADGFDFCLTEFKPGIGFDRSGNILADSLNCAQFLYRKIKWIDFGAKVGH